MRFFCLDESLLENWDRYVITIRTKPNKFEETYNALSKHKPSTNAAPVYIIYTFHLYGDSIMYSIIAKDEEAADQFIMNNMKVLPDVFRTNTTCIQKQIRLTSPESWKIYVKSNLIQQDMVTSASEASITV